MTIPFEKILGSCTAAIAWVLRMSAGARNPATEWKAEPKSDFTGAPDVLKCSKEIPGGVFDCFSRGNLTKGVRTPTPGPGKTDLVYICKSSSTLYMIIAGQNRALKKPRTPSQNEAACPM